MAAPLALHDFDVLEPTYCRLNLINFAAKDQLENLVSIISTFLPCRGQQAKILSEFKILNLVLYRRGGQLRKAKCFQLLKRVQTCLKRFGKFDKLFQLLLTLNNDLKSAASSGKSGKKNLYLPAGQSWSYVLYLHKLYKQLLESTAAYCITTFEHLSQQLAIGWLISSMVVFLGIVARVWALCETLTEKVVENYNTIYQYKEIFQRSASDWVEPSLPPFLCSTRNTRPALVKKYAQEQFTQHEAPETPDEKCVVQYEEDIGEPVTVKRKARKEYAGPHKKLKIDSSEDRYDELVSIPSSTAGITQPITHPEVSRRTNLLKLTEHEKKEKLKIGSQTITESESLRKKKKNKKKAKQNHDDTDQLGQTQIFTVDVRKAVTRGVANKETHQSTDDKESNIESMSELKISNSWLGLTNVNHGNKLKRKKKKKKKQSKNKNSIKTAEVGGIIT